MKRIYLKGGPSDGQYYCVPDGVSYYRVDVAPEIEIKLETMMLKSDVYYKTIVYHASGTFLEGGIEIFAEGSG